MPKRFEQLNGVISLASNSPGTPTGYGQQALYLVERMVQSGIRTAAMSNFGLEGRMDLLKVKGGKVPHYPRGITLYSDDVLPGHHARHRAGYEDLPHAIMTLYDCWVYQNPKLKELPIISWVPLDHVTLPPAVYDFVSRENVTPVSMAPHGKRQFDEAGVSNTYIPHAIDTKIYKPTDLFDDLPVRDFLGVKDEFVIGMFAANKAAKGGIHRKAYAENLLAVGVFMKENPNTRLYIHAEPSQAYGGFHLPNLLASVGIPEEKVIFPDPLDLRQGYSQKQMAALYTGIDVLLAPSYGEGFGVPTVEAQAAGARVVVSDWAASADLAGEDSWKVEGHPFWHESQSAWFKSPDIGSIVKALQQAEAMPRGPSEKSIEFASQFDADKVWQESWIPFLRDYFEGQK